MADYYYTAFISYRHLSPDQEIARKLHTMIETFPIPASLKQSSGRSKMGRVFRDQEELPLSKDLGSDIRNALDHSDWLIVICSPRYLESKWCMAELEYFISLGRRDHILTVLADGEPYESFPEQLRYEIVDGEKVEIEPLAADVRGADTAASLAKLKQEKLRVLAPMLGVNYDDLRQRARQRRNRMLALAMSAVILLLAGFLGYSLKKNGEITAERNSAQIAESKWLSQSAQEALDNGDKLLALLLALEAMPEDPADPDRPVVPEAVSALYSALVGGVADEYASLYEIDLEREGLIDANRAEIHIYRDNSSVMNVYDILTGERLEDKEKSQYYGRYTVENCLTDFEAEGLDVDGIAQLILMEGVEGHWDYKKYYLLLHDQTFSMNSLKDLPNVLYFYFSGAEDHILHTYETTKPHNRDYFNYHGGESMVDKVRNFGSSYDGRVIYAQEGRYIYFWDAASEEVLTVLSYLDFDSTYFCDSQISHDEPFVVFHTIGGSGYVYHYMTGEVTKLDSGLDTVDSVQLNADSKRVICLSKAGNCANIYLTATGDKVSAFTADFSVETAVYPQIDAWGYATDDSYIALMGDKKLKIYSQGTAGSNAVIAQVNDIVAHHGDYPVTFSADGNTLWTVDSRSGYSVAVVDSNTGELLWEYPTTIFMLQYLAQLDDRHMIDYGQDYYGNASTEENYDHALAVVFDTQTLEPVKEFRPVQVFQGDGETKTLEKFTLTEMQYDASGNRILFNGWASSLKDHAVFVYDYGSGEELWQINQRDYGKVLSAECGELTVRGMRGRFTDDFSEFLLYIQFEDDSNYYYPVFIERRDAETFELKERLRYRDHEAYEESEFYPLLAEPEKTPRFGDSAVSLEDGRLLDEEGNVLIDFGKDMTLLDSAPDGSQLAVTYYETGEHNEIGKILIVHSVDEQTLLDTAREILNGRELTDAQKQKYFLE